MTEATPQTAAIVEAAAADGREIIWFTDFLMEFVHHYRSHTVINLPSIPHATPRHATSTPTLALVTGKNSSLKPMALHVEFRATQSSNHKNCKKS